MNEQQAYSEDSSDSGLLGASDSQLHFRTLVDEVLRLSHQVSIVSGVVENLQSAVSIIEDRQAYNMAERIQDQHSGDDERHTAQTYVASQIEAFIDQDLLALAMATLPYFTSRSPRREWPARLIGRFSADLFRRSNELSINTLGLPRRAQNDLREQASTVIAEVRRFIEGAQATQLPFHWDYQFRAGRLLDHKWQQAWGPCDPALPVKFLVTPAYVVDGRIYLRQKVYTARPKAKISV